MCEKTKKELEVETIKSLTTSTFISNDGRRRKHKNICIKLAREIVMKKRQRAGLELSKGVKSWALCPKIKELQKYKKVKKLLKDSKENINTPYFKTLIVGNTGIYYASPVYGHSDYNKTRVFDKTEKTLKIASIFNRMLIN